MNVKKLMPIIILGGLGATLLYIYSRGRQIQASSVQDLPYGQTIVTPPAQTHTSYSYGYSYNINLESPSQVTPQLALPNPTEFFKDDVIKGDTKTTKTTSTTIQSQKLNLVRTMMNNPIIPLGFKKMMYSGVK